MENVDPRVGGPDNQRLVQTDEDSQPAGVHRRIGRTCSSPVRRHPRCFLVALAIFLILVAHAVVVYFLYFDCNSYNNCTTLHIMGLNTWGMPLIFGSKFKPERMAAIANEVSKAEYDIYLFTELWLHHDHDTIAAAVPEGYQISGFRELTLPTCLGEEVGFCSGLAIVSRIPWTEIEFQSYTEHGDWTKATIDGEWLARKGIGRVRITLDIGTVVDVFVTHTAADPDPSHGYNNSYYRIRQVRELIDDYVMKSDADVVLLGGDFNAGPDMTDGAPYATIRQHMVNCVEEFFYKLAEFLNPNFATYGNQRNCFSNMYDPIIYDYIFYKNNRVASETKAGIQVWTNWFEVPFYHFLDQKDEKELSFSDHEAVVATIHIRDNRN